MDLSPERKQLVDETLQLLLVSDHFRKSTGLPYDGSKRRLRDHRACADRVTDSVVVLIADIGPLATGAAGDFVVSQERMRELFAMAPKGWKGLNFEAVLETDVIQGNPGHTKVVATEFW